MFLSSQKGISLYIALIITSIILAIALGMSLVLVGQLKMTREIGSSTKAFFAADAGIEMALSQSIDEIAIAGGNYSASMDGTADYGYTVEIACCNAVVHPVICKISCPVGLSTDDNCLGQYLCYKSKGTYKDITRAIEIKR